MQDIRGVVSEEDVEAVIERLKHQTGARSDVELAAKLRLGRSTIASWRRRGSVPRRYQSDDAGDRMFFNAPLNEWTPEEHAAFGLAMLRALKEVEDPFKDSLAFRDRYWTFWTELLKQLPNAHGDILEQIREFDERGMTPTDPRAHLFLIAFHEFALGPPKRS